MDNQFKENVIKSFGIVKGDVTAIQATLADVSLAIADANSRHEKLVGEMHKLKMANVKNVEVIKALRAKIKAKKQTIVVRAKAKSQSPKRVVIVRKTTIRHVKGRASKKSSKKSKR